MLSFLFRTPLQKALAKVQKTGGSWYSISLSYCGFNPKIATIPEAKAVVAVLAEVERIPTKFADPQGIGFLCESFDNEAVRQHLVEHAQPILSRLALRSAVPRELSLACLRSLVKLGDKEGIAVFCQAVEDRIHPDDHQWTVIFRQVLAQMNGIRESVVERLSGKALPSVLQEEVLVLVNTLCREHGYRGNPFDSEQGMAVLRGLLADPALPGVGINVAANLPFVTYPGRSDLLSLCAEHHERDVRLEAAWAMARLGDSKGIQHLVRECADPIHAFRPLAYLEELGARKDLPPELRDPRHLALAEMANWLGHEMEYGEPPAEVAIIDDRILIWPTDGQQYRVFLIRYHYPASSGEDRGRAGIGMVGPTTFSLMGDSVIAPSIPVEHILALYCSWQLGLKDEENGGYSIPHGLAKIAALNPGFYE